MNKQPKIVNVSDDQCQVSLNIGRINGVELNDTFLIYSLSDHEIIDPDTNESLGFLEFVKGKGKVTHVQEKLCTVSSNTYKKPSSTRTITKHVPSSIFALSNNTTEETVIDGNPEQIPFDSPQIGDLAKRI